MKRCIFIFAMLLCIFPSYAISKKELIYKSNELENKILQEYKFKSNFDSISVVLQTAYYAKAKELIEKTYATYYGHGYWIGGRGISTDMLCQMRKEGVGGVYIKLNDKLSLSLSGLYESDLFWYFEGPYLLKEYPEIREIDSLLSKKKLYSYMLGPKSHNAIVSKWMENINYKPSIDDAVERYKREIREREQRQQREIEAEQRELQRHRAQIPKERTFIAVKYCEHDNTKWSEWKETDKKVVITKDYYPWDYISIDGYGYHAKPCGIDIWDCYHRTDDQVPFCSARLIKSKNDSYQLLFDMFLDKTSGTICYSLKHDDSNSPAARAKLSLNEWLLGIWQGNDDGWYSYIEIYKEEIKMRLHRYEGVWDYINDIYYHIDGNRIITNLQNGTITIDRSNGCLYFRGIKYTFKPL